MNNTKSLWTCPKCNQTFVTKNLWHSRLNLPVEDFFVNANPISRKLYNALLKVIKSFGPITVNRVKSGINFQARVRFAGVSKITKKGLICGFWLKRKIASPRFTKVEFIPPNNYIYRFLLTSAKDLDTEAKQ